MGANAALQGSKDEDDRTYQTDAKASYTHSDEQSEFKVLFTSS